MVYLWWASLEAQMVKNLPAMQETRVWSQGQEDPWRREQLPTLVFLSGESHGQRSLAGYSPWGHKESDMTEQLKLTNTMLYTQTQTVAEVRLPKWHCWVGKICVCLLPPASMNGSRIICFDGMSSSKNFSMWILTPKYSIYWLLWNKIHISWQDKKNLYMKRFSLPSTVHWVSALCINQTSPIRLALKSNLLLASTR